MRHALKTLPPQPRRSKRPKNWTRERRAQQAIIIHNWKPWTHATGPRTAAGKAISSKNALIHGARSARLLEEARRVRLALRRTRDLNALVRALCKSLSRAEHEQARRQNWRWRSRLSRDKFVAFAATPTPHRRA